MMSGRQLVVVDVKTTGPLPDRHSILEVAALNTATGQSWEITFPLTREELAAAEPEALRVHGYYRRGLAEKADAGRDQVAGQVVDLAAALAGNTLGGTFPDFAAAFLVELVRRYGISARWHHRTADIGSLTAGAFGMPPTKIPKFPVCCRLWKVEVEDDQSAEATVRSAAACFAALAQYNAADVLEPAALFGGAGSRLSVVPDLPVTGVGE